MRPALPMPAQFARMRATPFFAFASLMAASALAESDTSHLIAMPPISLACAFAASMFTSSSATLAPAFASSAAVAAPRPDPPPVTIAACPLMSIFLPPGNLVFRLSILDQKRDPLPAADASRRDAIAQVRPFQLARQGHGEAHAGRAERMADRDCAAVDVELVLVEIERTRAGHHLRTERLVDLEAGDVGYCQAGLLQHRVDRRHRADAHDLGRDARHSARDPARERRFAVLLRVAAGGRKRGRRAVDDRGGIAAGLRAAEGGADFRELLDRGCPHVGVVIDLLRLARERDAARVIALTREFFRFHRRDLAAKKAGLLRLHGALERTRRVGVH